MAHFNEEKHFFDLKAIFFGQFLQNAPKQQKSLFNCMWLILMWKALFLTQRDVFFCQFLQKCFKTLEKLRLALCGSVLWKINTLLILQRYFVWQLPQKWFRTPDKLYGAHYDEKNSFFTLKFFLLISVKMLHNTRKAKFSYM